MSGKDIVMKSEIDIIDIMNTANTTNVILGSSIHGARPAPQH
jgi:hypothetical protein